MKNLRHSGERLTLTAAAARTSGVPCMEAGFHGIPYTDAAIGVRYTLVAAHVQEIAFITSSAVGDTIHINTTTNALTRTAKGGSGGGGTEPFARVVAIPGTTDGPPTGQMWILQLPQVA